MRRILCFGDSNTCGYSPVDGQKYDDDVSWPGVMNRLLGDKFEVVNEGKNGRTIAFDDPYNEGCNGMNDIEACIDANSPLDLVIIMLGTNDLKVYFDATPQDVANNLLAMSKLVQEKTDAPIILASPALLGDQIEFSPRHLEFGRTQVDYSFDLAPAFEQVAKTVGAEFIDLAMVAVSSDVDCLHLMPEEHAKVAQAMKDKVFAIFKEELEQEAREEEEAAKEEELKRLQEEEAQRQREEEENSAEQPEEPEVSEESESDAGESGFETETDEADLDEEEQEARRKVEAILKAAEEEVSREEGSYIENSFVEVGQESAAGADFVSTDTLSEGTVQTRRGEKEKMLSGELYRCDEVLKQEMLNTRKLTGAYNQTSGEEEARRREILETLFQRVGEDAYIEPPFRCDYGSNISIGDNFYANFDCVMLDTGSIKIGNNVFFGPKVNVYAACHPIYAPVRNELLEYSKEVTIGDDVWIGGNVTINPGVHIGNNVVIGSGSVVTGDIPDGVVAAGNPCRIIRRISDADRQYWEEKKEEHDN